MAEAKAEAMAEVKAAGSPLRRQRTHELVAGASNLVRQISSGGSLAKLNGYDPEETYRHRMESADDEQEVSGLIDAEVAEEPPPPPAEAAHAAAQAELVSADMVAKLKMSAEMRAVLNAPHAAASAELLERRWLELAGWRDRDELLACEAREELARRVQGAATDGAADAGELLRLVLPPYAALEEAATAAAMVEVHEEDREWNGAAFTGGRAEFREALARITLQKCEDATRAAALQALERQMGGTVAAQSVQHVVVNAMMRKLQPRMQKLCDLKTAGLLEYGATVYLRLAEAAVPKRGA